MYYSLPTIVVVVVLCISLSKETIPADAAGRVTPSSMLRADAKGGNGNALGQPAIRPES